VTRLKDQFSVALYIAIIIVITNRVSQNCTIHVASIIILMGSCNEYLVYFVQTCNKMVIISISHLYHSCETHATAPHN